jgi:signal transduction histidine kinase
MTTAVWPLAVANDDDDALPPPWDGDVRFDDPQTESALLALQHGEPMLALRICRTVFCRAEARGDRQAAVHALYLAYVNLYNSSQRASADRMFALVCERATGIGRSQLSARIELARANQLSEQAEHAQAMVIRQSALESAMASGDIRLIFLTLLNLAVSAAEAGDSALILRLCEQQEPLLAGNDPVIDSMRCHRANVMAAAWQQTARAHEAAGERNGAQRALQQAQVLARAACALANNDREALHCLDTLVQILLRLNDAAQARHEFERGLADLRAAPSVGSDLWRVLELARMRIDVHEGRVGAQTVQTLEAIEASVGPAATDLQMLVGDVRQVLLQAQEQLGQGEQALASHKRATDWHARRHSAQSRERIKMLRHTVLAMRAEAVEFITHDLLTPLAAAQTWSQALLRERLPTAAAAPLRAAHRQLVQGTTMSGHYLDLWRAELAQRAQLKVLDLGALVDDCCENFSLPSSNQPLRIERDLRVGICVRGDRVLLTRMLTLLLAHACEQAHHGSPHVRLRLSATADDACGKALLLIEHAGANPSHALRTRIFQRFDDGVVAGNVELGWLIVASVVHLHRARLRFAATSDGGSSMQLVLASSTVLHDGAVL